MYERPEVQEVLHALAQPAVVGNSELRCVHAPWRPVMSDNYFCRYAGIVDVHHVLPYWPRERYLELAPKYWAATRARIPAEQLAVDIGDITVPPLLPTQEQPTTR